MVITKIIYLILKKELKLLKKHFLETANLTKKELALKIKEYLPNTEIISSEIGKDPDKRNYIVSNEKIEKAGFRAKRSLDLGIKELIKYYSFITKKNSNI